MFCCQAPIISPVFWPLGKELPPIFLPSQGVEKHSPGFLSFFCWPICCCCPSVVALWGMFKISSCPFRNFRPHIPALTFGGGRGGDVVYKYWQRFWSLGLASTSSCILPHPPFTFMFVRHTYHKMALCSQIGSWSASFWPDPNSNL